MLTKQPLAMLPSLPTHRLIQNPKIPGQRDRLAAQPSRREPEVIVVCIAQPAKLWTLNITAQEGVVLVAPVGDLQPDSPGFDG